MQLEDYFEFLSEDNIRIKGHRITVHHVVRAFLEGYTPEEIALDYPGLSLEKIYATITYYLHNRTQVDASLLRLKHQQEQDYQQWAKHPSPVVQRLRQSKF